MVSYTTFAVIVTMASAYLQAAGNPLTGTHQVFSRQETGDVTLNPDKVPDVCRDSCSPLSVLVDGSCTTNECICTEKIRTTYISCAQCGLANVGSTFLEGKAQEVYDAFVSGCKAAGVSEPSFTFSTGAGGNNSPPSTGASASGSSRAFENHVGKAGLMTVGALSAAFLLGA